MPHPPNAQRNSPAAANDEATFLSKPEPEQNRASLADIQASRLSRLYALTLSTASTVASVSATLKTPWRTAPLATRQAKKSIHYGLQMDLASGYRFEIEAYNRLVDTEDRREGIRAFNEKRKPNFQGR
jgi:enoyl-CoA hydratase/carnithine racemase